MSQAARIHSSQSPRAVGTAAIQATDADFQLIRIVVDQMMPETHRNQQQDEHQHTTVMLSDSKDTAAQEGFLHMLAATFALTGGTSDAPVQQQPLAIQPLQLRPPAFPDEAVDLASTPSSIAGATPAQPACQLQAPGHVPLSAYAAGSIPVRPHNMHKAGRPPRPRSFTNLALALDPSQRSSHGSATASHITRLHTSCTEVPPDKAREPGEGHKPAALRDLFNTLVKMIEAHVPSAQRHRLQELKQAIARLKAKKDRAGLHGPLDAFLSLVHQWAPKEQWGELQRCAAQAGIKLVVDGRGEVHIRRSSVVQTGKPPGHDLRKEMLKQQANRTARAAAASAAPDTGLPNHNAPQHV